jgi:MoxR-like ATPase
MDIVGRLIKFQGKRDDWKSRPLVMITTNKERPLPQPFIRRCVVLEIPKPKRKLLRSIAARNFPGRDVAFFDTVLNAVLASRGGPAAAGGRSQPAVSDAAPAAQQSAGQEEEFVDVSIAEYTDTLRACDSLANSADPLSSSLLDDIVKRTVFKERALRPQ